MEVFAAMIVLEIPRSTPSMNSTHHKHWRVMYAQKKLWAQEIWAAHFEVTTKSGDSLAKQPPHKAKVSIDRYGHRLLDVDNYLGGLKSVIDGLKAEGLIVDDSAEYLELVATQHKGTPRTVIKIEPA